MSREDPHFKLRIPPGLKRKVYESAVVNERSMTAEINSRLESTFVPADVPEPVIALKEIIERATALIALFEERNKQS